MSEKNRVGGTLGHAPSMPLRALDEFEVAEGYPDIRGWEVATADGSVAGRVEELLVDTEALRVTHVVVRSDTERTMVPIEAVELQADGRRAFIKDPAAMRDVPTFGKPRTDAVAAAIGVLPKEPVAAADETTSERRRPIVDGAMRADEVAKREVRVPLVGEEHLSRTDESGENDAHGGNEVVK